MSLLKIIASEFIAWNLSSDRENRHPATMAIVETVDEVDIPWAATPCAHRKLPGELSICARSVGSDLFVAHKQPVNVIALTHDIC